MAHQRLAEGHAVAKVVKNFQQTFAKPRGHALRRAVCRKGGLKRAQSFTQEYQTSAAKMPRFRSLSISMPELDLFERYLRARNLLQQYHFCTLSRKTDAGTQWFVKMVRANKLQPRDVLANAIIFALLPKYLGESKLSNGGLDSLRVRFLAGKSRGKKHCDVSKVCSILDF